MWFETIVASAMVETMTIEVAEEKPPRNASSASPSRFSASGSVSTKRSGLRSRQSLEPHHRDRHDEEAHQR